MARKSNFIGTTETGQLSAIGNKQQREFEFIRNLINDDSILKYYAEPSVHENHEKIDWYSEGEGQVKKFQDFSDEEISVAQTELNELMTKLKKKSENAKTVLDRETILNLSILPDQDSIKKVGDQLVIINWAYKLHKREKTGGDSANFAGLADPIHQQEIQPSAREETDETPSIKAKVNTQKNETYNEPISDANALEEPTKEANADLATSLEDSKPKDHLSSISWLSNAWLWIALFLFLLLLNILMLKDACGIKSIPFLYFC